MSITRGEFLKSLKKAIPGMVLGGGTAMAAQKLLGKMAAASSASGLMEVQPALVQPKLTDDAKINFIKSGPAVGNRIALTFDDGPTPGVTDRILDELQRRQLHASFFMIGQRVAAAPDLARRVLDEGHDIGNHTFTHLNLTTLPDQQAEDEIEKTQDIMDGVLHHRPAWFRPPFGALRQNQAALLAEKGMAVVLWSIDSGDWSHPASQKIANDVLSATLSGSIILCHDLHSQTADAVGPILDGLLERGFTFCTVSTLLHQRNP
jgi:peptidoglycan/xylan/chitin deacetylase (PgdA/CDA1 family)